MTKYLTRAGLCAIALSAVCASVPASAQDDMAMRHHMMHRMMRHEMHHEMMHRMMRHEMRHRMMRHEMHREMMHHAM